VERIDNSYEVDKFGHTSKTHDKFGQTRKGNFDIHNVHSCHVEVVTLLQLSNRKPDAKIRIDIDLEDYYQIKDKKQRTE